MSGGLYFLTSTDYVGLVGGEDLASEVSMRNYQVYYKFEDPYSSEYDSEGAQTVEASSEDAAVAVFREDHPEERYTIQCVFAEVSQ